MSLRSSKDLINKVTAIAVLCFISATAVADDSKISLVNSAVLDGVPQYVAIGTTAIVNNNSAITHSWFIDAVRGAPIVCSAIVGFENRKCITVGPATIPHPAPPGVRYRGLGVASVVRPGIAVSHAWYIDEFSKQVFVCQVLADLQNGSCTQMPIPKV